MNTLSESDDTPAKRHIINTRGPKVSVFKYFYSFRHLVKSVGFQNLGGLNQIALIINSGVFSNCFIGSKLGIVIPVTVRYNLESVATL